MLSPRPARDGAGHRPAFLDAEARAEHLAHVGLLHPEGRPPLGRRLAHGEHERSVDAARREERVHLASPGLPPPGWNRAEEGVIPDEVEPALRLELDRVPDHEASALALQVRPDARCERFDQVDRGDGPAPAGQSERVVARAGAGDEGGRAGPRRQETPVLKPCREFGVGTSEIPGCVAAEISRGPVRAVDHRHECRRTHPRGARLESSRGHHRSSARRRPPRLSTTGAHRRWIPRGASSRTRSTTTGRKRVRSGAARRSARCPSAGRRRCAIRHHDHPIDSGLVEGELERAPHVTFPAHRGAAEEALGPGDRARRGRKGL